MAKQITKKVTWVNRSIDSAGNIGNQTIKTRAVTVDIINVLKDTVICFPKEYSIIVYFYNLQDQMIKRVPIKSEETNNFQLPAGSRIRILAGSKTPIQINILEQFAFFGENNESALDFKQSKKHVSISIKNDNVLCG